MDAFEALLGRSSVSTLVDPPPSGAVLDRILGTGLRAPDHGRMRPWRFVLVRGAARTALADVVAAALRRREPEVPDGVVEKQRGKFLRAPLVVGLGARIVPSGKVPEIEQLMSVGAAGMNLLNAVHAAGFGGIWVTGAHAHDPEVAAALGLTAPDRLLGFLFIGSAVFLPDRPVPARPALPDHVVDWTGSPV